MLTTNLLMLDFWSLCKKIQITHNKVKNNDFQMHLEKISPSPVRLKFWRQIWPFTSFSRSVKNSK